MLFDLASFHSYVTLFVDGVCSVGRGEGARPLLGFSYHILLFFLSSPTLSISFGPSHSATDDDLKIQIENSGKKSLFALLVQ